MATRNRPWAYADRQLLRTYQADRFKDAAQKLGQSNVDPGTWDKLFGGQTANELDQKYTAPAAAKKSGGGGFLGGLKDLAGDVGGAALTAIQAPLEYVGKPIAGAVSGVDRTTDANGQRHGGQSLFQWAKNVADTVTSGDVLHPQRLAKQWDEYTSTLPWYGQVAANVAADPLSFVGPGIAKAVIPGSSKAAAAARALIDQGGGRAVVGGAFGGAGAAKVAQDAGAPDSVVLGAGLLGGVGGGVAGLNAGRAFERFRPLVNKDAIGRALAQEAPVMGANGTWKTKGGQKAAEGFQLEPPPAGEYVFPHAEKLDPAEVRARVKHYIENGYEESAPANPEAKRIDTTRGPYYAGRKNPVQWEEETAAILTPDEIRAAGNWYRELAGEFEKRYGPENAPKMLDTYLASQVNVTVEGGMTNTLRAVDKARGLKGDKVGGTSRPHEEALIGEFKGEAPTAWKSDKIWDFMDSARGKRTRTYMGNDPRAGQPFAGDVHQARDAGYIDETTKNWLERETGQTLDQLGLKQDYAGSAKPDDTQYQWLSKWGNNLVQDLNAKNWMGRSDWLASDVQAIGWMKFRKLLGADGGTIEDAFKANTRRISIEAAPGTGSPLDRQFGGRFYALPTEQQAQVTNDLMDRLAAAISERTGNPVRRGVTGPGFWGDYPSAHSYQWDVVASPEGAQDVVNLAAYVSQQTEVLGHRFKPSSPTGGIRFTIENATPDQVEQFYRRMRETAGLQGAAPTEDGLVTLDIDGAWGKNGTRGYENRRDAIIAQASAISDELGINAVADDYPVEVIRAQNNWEEVPDGGSHLQGIVARGGGLGDLAHQLSAEYTQWFGEALQRAESGGGAGPVAGFTGSSGSFRDVARNAYGGTPARAVVQAGASAAYGAANPGEDQSPLEGALSAAGLSLLRSFGVDPRIITNALKARGMAQEGMLSKLTQEEAAAAGRNWKPPLEGDVRQVLGLDPTKTYTADEIRSAYRQRMREYHPDINASDTAKADAQRINAAFEQWSQGMPPAGGAGASSSPPGGAGAAPPPPTGGAGSPPPPPPPQAPPAPPAPPPRAARDLLNLSSAGTARQHAADYLKSARGRIDQGLRKAVANVPVLGKLDPNMVKDTEVTPFVVKAKNAIANRINSYEGYADRLMGKLEDTGVKVTLDQNGDWRMANGTPFEDMVELRTPQGRAAYAALTNAQQSAVDDLVEFNLRLNDTLRFHGKGLNIDPSVEAAYFPRLVKGKNGIEKAYVGSNGGPGLSSTGSFMKDRVHASLEEGITNGVDYAHPREAYRAMVRAKLRVAGDSYVAEALRPLGMSEQALRAAGGQAGFNYVQLPPTIAPQLNGTWFPRETAERIVASLAPQGKWMPAELAKGVNTVLTPMRATADISWFLQQGAAMMFRHPLRANAGAAAVIKSAVGDPAKYRQLLDSTLAEGAARVGMSTEDYAQFLVSRGLQLTPDDLGGDVIAFKGLQGGTNAPVLKQAREGYQAVGRFSNETFSRYANYSRFVLANDAVELAMKTGQMDQLESALAAVNRMTGATGRKTSQLESIFEFAPKFFSAAVEQTAAAVSKGGIEGQLARRHIGTMLGVAALTATAINTARGYETDFDPRSNNFLRIRNVGGLDVSLMGTYDTLFRAIAGAAAGPSGEAPHPDIKRLWRLAEGKMSPALAAVYYPFIKQSTYNGEPLDPLGSWEGAGRTAYEYGKSVVPFSAQSYLEQGIEPAIEQRDPSKLLSGAASELAGATGLTNSPVTPTENRNWSRDSAAKRLFGSDYESLAGAQKSQVNEDKDVQRFQTEADRNTLTREDDRSSMTKLQLDSSAQIDELSKELESGKLSGNEFRDQLRTINDQLRGARKVLEQKDSSGTLGGWFDLYDQAALPDGRTDYTKLDQLQADYRAKHPKVDQELLKSIGAHDNATMREYRQAQALAKEYYAIPAYKGLSLEDSQKAGRALSAAQAMVSYGQARTMAQAIWMISKTDPATAKLMRIAQNRGSNPLRKKFRKANPLLGKYYSDALAA